VSKADRQRAFEAVEETYHAWVHDAQAIIRFAKSRHIDVLQAAADVRIVGVHLKSAPWTVALRPRTNV
jgi:hypothetical protein